MGLLRLTENFCNLLIKIGGVAFVSVVGITCADILLRLFWKPIFGAVEIVMYSNALALGFALGATQWKKGNIAVDILVNTFGKRTKKLLNILNSLLCASFFTLILWQTSKYATTLWKTGELSETLKIPYYPFIYGLALGCLSLVFVFIAELVREFTNKEHN